jgi:glycosyltransferase involved in cell wall biosynthesis
VIRLSLAMIVKDEERTLDRVLADATTFCDELVVADTGSTDATKCIAAAAGARVIDVPWTDNFAAARNACFESCTGDWIIWLDADDTVPPDVQQQLLLLKQQLTDEHDAVWLTYSYHFDSTGTCTFAFPRERIVRRAAGLKWAGAVHEVISVPAGRSLERLDLRIEHRPYPGKDAVRKGRNLRILEREFQAGDRSVRTLFYLANELLDAGRYEDALASYSAYLQVSELNWERHQAFMNMSRCAVELGREQESVEYLHRALREDASRSVTFIELGRRHFERGDWAQALPWFAAATALSQPAVGFVEPPDYSWRPLDYLSVCQINLGRFEEGIATTTRALLAGHPDAARLRANICWAADRLGH